MTAVSKLPSSLLCLSWAQLNEVLLECDDLPTLKRWVNEMAAESGSVYRVVRVHGRMNAVRRAQEIKVIKTMVEMRRREEKTR